MWIYALSVAVSFVSVFLKGFQHKNVIGTHMRSVFFTSYLMAAFDVAAVTLIVKGGWLIAFTSGTGAAFGMVAAIKVHDHFYKSKDKSMFIIEVGIQRGQEVSEVVWSFPTQELHDKARQLIRSSKHLSVRATSEPLLIDSDDKLARKIEQYDATGYKT